MSDSQIQRLQKRSLKVFRYIDELDCFVVTKEYHDIACELGLVEWNPVVWIGRLFMLDNDYGEHWFDNWHLRDEIQDKVEALGLEYDEMLIIDPDRFANGADGPCNEAKIRKQFWTDVLKSMELSYSLLFEKARETNEGNRSTIPEEYIEDLEERIQEIESKI